VEIKVMALTGAETILAKAALKTITALSKLVINKIEENKKADLDAIEAVLRSMQDAIELNRDIKEAQDAVEEEELDLDDWITD
jgi:hypothetical protein